MTVTPTVSTRTYVQRYRSRWWKTCAAIAAFIIVAPALGRLSIVEVLQPVRIIMMVLISVVLGSVWNLIVAIPAGRQTTSDRPL